jgi:hypothetical protein
LKKLFIKYILKFIGNILKEGNVKSKNLKKTLGKIPGIGQKFLDTNNLIKIGQDTIKKQVLTHLIKTIKRKDVNDILRKFLLRWKENKDKYLLKVKVLQSFFRKTLALKKELTLKKLNFILLSIFNKNDNNMKEILRSTFRKWQLRNQLGKCNDSSMIIQEFVVPRLFRVLRNKILKFFTKLARKKIGRRLNDLIKIRNLRNTLIKVYFKRVVKHTQGVIKNEDITKSLKSTFDKKDLKEKELNLRKYLLDWNKRVNDWVDVKERMPEKTGDYLCIMPDGEQEVVYFDAEIDRVGYEFPFGFADLDYPDESHSVPVWIEVRVLFWQPLPLSYVKQKDGSYVDTQKLKGGQYNIDWGLEEGENHE